MPSKIKLKASYPPQDIIALLVKITSFNWSQLSFIILQKIPSLILLNMEKYSQKYLRKNNRFIEFKY